MFLMLAAEVSRLRLSGPAGLVAAVQDDLGRELVDAGLAVELTREEFHERLSAETLRHDCASRVVAGRCDV